MSGFRFRRLEEYKVGDTKDGMELNVPLPITPSGKICRWCPNGECTPRLFLLGHARRPERLEVSQLRRAPGERGTTCPYCGTDADDAEFNYGDDIEAVQERIEWAALRDISDYMEELTRDFNRSQPRGGLLSVKMEFEADAPPEPRAWREDLVRNLACDLCGREYGVYAIALFCPDCGSANLHVHFEREIEIVLQQIDLAEQLSEEGNRELSYRLLGNAHEDVLTAFETYQKAFFRYAVRKRHDDGQAERMISKQAIGSRFQNPKKAKDLYEKLSLNPFSVLTTDEMELMQLNIEKRHVIGHNLSIADEAYCRAEQREEPGTTVEILADEVSEFAKTAQKVVVELERLM